MLPWQFEYSCENTEWRVLPKIFALLQLIRASPPDWVKLVDHRSWPPRANQQPRAAFSGSCVPKFSPKQPISPCALPRICATITSFFSGMFQIISQRWPNKGLNLLPPIIKFQPLLPFSREWAVCTTIIILIISFFNFCMSILNLSWCAIRFIISSQFSFIGKFHNDQHSYQPLVLKLYSNKTISLLRGTWTFIFGFGNCNVFTLLTIISAWHPSHQI